MRFHEKLEMSGDDGPRTLQPVYETIYTSLDRRPDIAVVRGMEAGLTRTTEILKQLPHQTVRWQTELRRARAALDLCHAWALDDPSEGLGLAARALESDAHLETRVHDYIRKAARDIGELYVQRRRYAGAVDGDLLQIKRWLLRHEGLQ